MGAFFLHYNTYDMSIIIKMKIGFIGTGKIAYSVITGICNSKISFTKIVISSRNKKVANKLKKKFKRVIYW